MIKSKSLYFGGGIVLFFVFTALFANFIAPYDPSYIFSNSIKVEPFWSSAAQGGFPLGTDDVGRDVFSRLVHGSRVSIGVGLFVVILTTFLGTAIGVLSASAEGVVDTFIMRIMDIILSLPSILLAMVVVAILGPGLTNTILAISVVALPNVVRVVRSSVLIEKQKDYVLASSAFGAGWFRKYIIGILPNCLGPLLVQASMGFGDGILSAAALGFLGLGVQPPTPEWGTMLSDSRAYLDSAPWLVTLPGVCILFLVLGFNLLADGLRDQLDPKNRGRR